MLRGKVVTQQLDSRCYIAEERLMLAVLEQAFSDLENTCPAVYADAEAYFLAYRDESSAFSLDAVCSQFKISTSAIRAEVPVPPLKFNPGTVTVSKADPK